VDFGEPPLSIPILLAAAVFILLTIGFTLVFARLISRDRIDVLADDLESILSPTRYRPMERLLAEADQKLLEAAGDLRLQRKFRRMRVKICRGYMQQLSDDFTRICKAIKVLLVTSKQDRPELAGSLMKEQFIFIFAMMAVEMKLLFYSAGVSTVDVSAVTQSLDTVRAQLQLLVAAAEPSAA
jgi:hypothetical protein